MTEKERLEAELLSQHLCKMDMKAFYVSSMCRNRILRLLAVIGKYTAKQITNFCKERP